MALVGLSIPSKFQEIFKLMACRRADEDAPRVEFETMGTLVFNRDRKLESLRLRAGTHDTLAPKARRPSPTDARSRAYSTAYHTHFYDPQREYNVPTVQDVLMFVVYNTVSRFFCGLDPAWGAVRSSELVMTDLGVYIIQNAPDEDNKLSDRILAKPLSRPSVVAAVQGNGISMTGSPEGFHKLIESIVFETAHAVMKKPRGGFADKMMETFPELTAIDHAKDLMSIRFMQQADAQQTYLDLFRLVGVRVDFVPWPDSGHPLTYKAPMPAIAVEPLND